MIFALSKEEELNNKPFYGTKKLGHYLYEKTLKVADKSGLPVIIINENKQIGGSFGEKFTNAIQQVFAKGYDGVITIGNDCPALSINHILKAKQSLLNNEIGIGPTSSGGFYLLAIAKEDFDYSKFLDFSWKTTGILNEVLNYAALKNNYTLLNTLAEINYYSDLFKLDITQIRDHGVYSSILALVSNVVPIVSRNYIAYKKIVLHTIFNKGSPYFFQDLAS